MQIRRSESACLVAPDVYTAHEESESKGRVWRKLSVRGVPLGNSGYLLPNNPMNQERFEWLAQPYASMPAKRRW